MTKFYFKFKKPYFWPVCPIIGGKKSFPKKIWLCQAQPDKGFQHHAKIQRNRMIQFQEDILTDGRMEGRTDPISQDPSSYHQDYNKYNCSRLAFESQRYRERCWCNQKLLHHCQILKTSSIHKLILKIQQILGSGGIQKVCSL